MDANLNTVTADEIDAIDAALGDLELSLDAGDDAVIEEITESEPETVSADAAIEELTELDAADVAAIETEIAKEEAYESQEADSEVGDTTTERDEDEAAAVAQSANAAAPAKPKKAAAPKTPRAPRDLSSLPEDAFVLTSDVPADLAANKAAVIAAAPAQKKVAEKYENLLLSVAANKQPSTYTMDCFRVLAKKGEVTGAELVAALRATKKKDGSTYTEGTARSQAGQIMALFPALKIAVRAGNKLTLNADSTLADALKGMLEKEEA